MLYLLKIILEIKLIKEWLVLKLSPYKNEINHKKLGPAQALIQSVGEVYFVTTSTLKYLRIYVGWKG